MSASRGKLPGDARAAIDVGGPVLAELFVVTMTESGIVLTGPCGPAAWVIEVGDGEDPMQTGAEVVGRVIGPPLLLHSTSWRRDRTGVVLSFLVVVQEDQVSEFARVPVGRAALARGGVVDAPTEIASNQVLEHALRHLAWLAQDDAVVDNVLDVRWHELLEDYVPEPFRHLAVAPTVRGGSSG